MTAASFFNQARTLAKRFHRAEAGNVAAMFAIALIPIMGAVGGAIDYARINNARTAMQAALDTAALMVSKDATSTMTASQINQKAQDYFNALYKHSEVHNITVNATYTNSTSKGSQIVIKGSGTMSTDFLQVVGYPSLTFGASSTTVWGTTKLRVALVLDNTGSMSSSGKMTALKTAAKSLIDTLSTAAKTNGDVYVSIVPFAKAVNVNSIATSSTTWLRWDFGLCTKTSTDWRGRTTTTTVQPNDGYMTQSDCTGAGGTNWSSISKSGWQGCVSDRNQSYDTLSTAPYSTQQTASNATNLATQFPAVPYSACPQAITPLSYNWTTLKTNIDAMQPNGGTNQAIGVAWGWLSLLQQSPLNAPAEDSNYKYTKAIILLSDGDNTQDRWYGDGTTSDSRVDARQKILCDNIKAAGITIYTIQVNTNNDNNSSVMSYCASSTSNYFSTTTASGINTAFSSIGTSLSKLRIAK